jgi:hypothetical protein
MTNGSPILKDNVYNFLKNLVQIVLPAAATLYLSMAGIWGLPAAEQVAGSMAAIATFIGVLLRISTKAYNASDLSFDGNMIVSESEDGVTLYSLELNGDPEALLTKKSVSFKVN